VENPDNVMQGIARIEMDGNILKEKTIPLTPTAETHEILVIMGDRRN
jgi:hypothetical protein